MNANIINNIIFTLCIFLFSDILIDELFKKLDINNKVSSVVCVSLLTILIHSILIGYGIFEIIMILGTIIYIIGKSIVVEENEGTE